MSRGILVFGLLAASALAAMVVRSARRDQEHRIESRADQLRDALAVRFFGIEQQLLAFAAHLSTSRLVSVESAARFHELSVRMDHPAGWRAVAYLPLVPEANRDALDTWIVRNEASYRAEGYPPFELVPPPPVEPTRALLPALLVEPPEARPSVFGFDAASSPERRRAAQRAISTGRLSTSAPVALSQDEDRVTTSVLLVAPVELHPNVVARSHLPSGLGVVAAGVTPHALVAEIAQGMDMSADDVSLQWEAVSGGEAVAHTEEGSRSFRVELGDRALFVRNNETATIPIRQSVLAGVVFITTFAATLFASAYVRRIELQSAIVEKRLQDKEDALRRAEQSSARQRRMEALGRLVGGVAHDFNNLLTVIMGNLEALGEQRLDPEQRLMVDEARHASERGAELTRRLLTFGRRTNLHPEPVRVDELLGDLSQMLGRVLPETVELRLQVDPEPAIVSVDRGELENAILNLTINARDSMVAGGRLELAGGSTTIEEATAKALEIATGDYASIRVVDEGSGMDSETRERAFEPFFTTKEVGRGSGLGLSAVLGFAQQSGGTVRLDSEVGRGTTVEILLPVDYFGARSERSST